ncbi:hypothetical protein KZP23_10580 [Echinicola marina]|uniref:hypothetical protein n=1 Tax=Echinicola marina TaxID=2859768 RepID=UPI001CF71143|nr:hypothetical protein [Echinicola marina]UCS95418.1 hypothetical protein KZP23_10580 [Echinicola marina]
MILLTKNENCSTNNHFKSIVFSLKDDNGCSYFSMLSYVRTYRVEVTEFHDELDEKLLDFIISMFGNGKRGYGISLYFNEVNKNLSNLLKGQKKKVKFKFYERIPYEVFDSNKWEGKINSVDVSLVFSIRSNKDLTKFLMDEYLIELNEKEWDLLKFNSPTVNQYETLEFAGAN